MKREDVKRESPPSARGRVHVSRPNHQPSTINHQPSTKLRLHAIEPATRANGPGLRAAVWFQGCTLGCPGCFNPRAHDPAGGFETDTAAIAEQLLANPHGIEGVTFSGGEPFQQPEALLDLLARLCRSPLSKLAFSGYTLPELQQLPLGPEILSRLDVLVAGRYVQALHLGAGLLGSSNQQIHLLTGRYRREDFSEIPIAEVILHADGRVTLTGMTAVRLELGEAMNNTERRIRKS